jgi:hypothetical protein
MQFRLPLATLAALSLILVGNAGAEEPLGKKYKVVADLAYKQGGSEYESELCKLGLYVIVGRNHSSIVGSLQSADDEVAKLMLKFIRKHAGTFLPAENP